MRRFVQFLVYSNVWIGLGATAFLWQFYLIYKAPVDLVLFAFVFFSTLLTYTFQRYVKLMNKTRSGGERLNWMQRYPTFVKGLLILGTTGTVYSLTHFNFETFIILAVTGFISLFYVVKLPGKLGKNLRDIPSLKIFLIGFVWAVISTFLPKVNLSVDFWPWLLFAANFIFIIAITIPFDIRDLDLDEKEKKTIPQIIGKKKAILLASFLLLINFFLLVFITQNWLITSFFGCIASILLVIGSIKKPQDLYYSLFVDGLLLLQPALLYVDLYWLECSI